jgi:putative methyltransferase (TIGR04325 family)
LRRLLGRGISLEGPVVDWFSARARSMGYDDDALIQRVRLSTRAVKNGQAAFERDGVAFPEFEDRLPLLAALMSVAAANCGSLHVLDFGGALGSTYWQHRRWLDKLPNLRWIVVEQPSLVALGQSEFTGPTLGFADSVAHADVMLDRPVILAGSVLQYLEHHERVLEQFASSNAIALLIDRVPVSSRNANEVCVQRVPKSIGEGSYPCTVFSRQLLLERLQRDWALVSELPCDEQPMRTTRGLPVEWCGFFLERCS